MDNETFATLLLLVAGVFSLIAFILFVRLCGRIKDIREAFFLVHDLEKTTVMHETRYEYVDRIRKKSHSEGPIAV